jgi:hypothetical protein
MKCHLGSNPLQSAETFHQLAGALWRRVNVQTGIDAADRAFLQCQAVDQNIIRINRSNDCVLTSFCPSDQKAEGAALHTVALCPVVPVK